MELTSSTGNGLSRIIVSDKNATMSEIKVNDNFQAIVRLLTPCGHSWWSEPLDIYFISSKFQELKINGNSCYDACYYRISWTKPVFPYEFKVIS